MARSAAAHNHAVQFYASDSTLFTTVAAFLAEGLTSGQPTLIIATPAHRAAIVEHLCGRLIDCDRAIRDGDLLLLDAQSTLDLFMIDGEPQPTMFFDNVGRLIEQALNGHQSVLRAYGEMVDVLWRAGRAEAAIKLEILWNRLAAKYRFSLLCGYSLGNFYKQPQGIDLVCAHHSHVVSEASRVTSFPSRAEKIASSREH